MKKIRAINLATAAMGILLLTGIAKPNLPIQRVESQGATLKEQAKRAGGRLLHQPDPDRSTIYSDIEALLNSSKVVIVGHTESNRCQLRPDGKFVTTDFHVKVVEAIKGNVKKDETILVSSPGGFYRFFETDGPVDVMVRMKGYAHPLNGRTYVFFLDHPKLDRGYDLTGGPQGQYDITDGVVHPANQWMKDPLVVKYLDKDVTSFLEEIRNAARKKR
jgi:hypothetical protein